MKRTRIKQIALTTLLVPLACRVLFAQQIASLNESPGMILRDEEASPADAADIVFSNLGPSPDNRYNTITVAAPILAGKFAEGQTESWCAVRFIPDMDVQAKVLMAAVGYSSGTKLVKLGVYSNDDSSNTVGEPLPGGQGSTTQIPDLGECCQLAKVTLPGEGVILTGGTKYWLVAKPDNVHGPDFSGAWHVSNLCNSAFLEPRFPWNPHVGSWPAAQIRGTRLQTLPPANRQLASPEWGASRDKISIFSSLDRSSNELYIPGIGALIAGNDVPLYPEAWEALPFTPKADVRATMLAAAIGYIAGAKIINLGIAGDNGGVPGRLLPDGQGSTTDIPDSGECCDLAKVRLPGAGVALTGGTQYWLVVSPDNLNAPDFHGIWQFSSLAFAAYLEPEHLNTWTDFTGQWFSAEIRGTIP